MDYPFNLLNYTDRKLLELTDDFTFDDWNKIRNKEYWEERDTCRNAFEANAFEFPEF